MRSIRVSQSFAKVVAGMALVGVCFVSPEVSALDKNQIVQMTKLGLDDKAIKGAIDGAGSELKLTPEEVGELRLEGVSEDIINHLKATGRVAGEATTQTAPDPAPGPGPAPSDSDVSLEPAPAPSEEESEEERLERERIAKEYEEEVMRKAEELNRQKEQESQREQRLQQMARRLPEAKELVESGSNMEAARIYLEFLSLEPAPESDEWYEARFGLARSLYNQGILSGATEPLLEVLLSGADKPYFVAAFAMLRKLTQEIGYRPPILEELTQLYIGDLNPDFQASFNYYMGKFFFDYSRSELAIEYLQKVPAEADEFPEALYIMGIARLDPAVNDIPGALYNFQNAIEAAEAQNNTESEILQLGYLALARTWYELGLYDVALFYYQKIPKNSSRNAQASFETTWTYFMKNDYKRALGSFHTLNSPYYSKWYYPDLFVLEATVYLNLCKFEQSQLALAQFQKEYMDQQPRLSEFLTNTTEPKSYWDAMMRVGQSGQELPPVFANAVLDTLEFYNIYRVVKNLRQEKAALESNVASLGEFGQSVLDRVDEQLNTKVEEGGILVQQKLSELDRELTDWDLKATQISFEIDSEAKRQLEAQLLNQDQPEVAADTGTTFLVVADDWQSWEFEGEYWIDEVPNYRSSLRTECIEQ